MKIRFATLLSADIQIEIGGKIRRGIDLDTPQGSHQTPWLRVVFGLYEMLDYGVQRLQIFVAEGIKLCLDQFFGGHTSSFAQGVYHTPNISLSSGLDVGYPLWAFLWEDGT